MTASTPKPADMSPARARFTDAEVAYLMDEPRLGRLATADAAGLPHVVPVGWTYNRGLGTIDISGRHFAATRKYRNVLANPQAAFVIDDVLPPFQPRCVMVQGRAIAVEGSQFSGSGAMIRLIPDKIISWGIGSDPVA